MSNLISRNTLIEDIQKLKFQVNHSEEVGHNRPFVDIANVLSCIDSQRAVYNAGPDGFLPCKVGDTAYYIDNDTKEIGTITVKYFTVTKQGITAMLKEFNINFWKSYSWGKNVFATYEEAEHVRVDMGGV